MSVLRPRHDPCVTCPLHAGWDNPTCTEGVVSVHRGERAVMGCNISNPFLSVAVFLSTPGASVQTLFRVRSPGCFCREGWQLQVQGGEAQLVIDNASDSQTGCYKWHLQGLQRNIGVTTLNVSGEDGIFVHPRPAPGVFVFGRGRGVVLFPPKVPRAPGWGPENEAWVPTGQNETRPASAPPRTCATRGSGGGCPAQGGGEAVRLSRSAPGPSLSPAWGRGVHLQPLQSFVCPRRARCPMMPPLLPEPVPQPCPGHCPPEGSGGPRPTKASPPTSPHPCPLPLPSREWFLTSPPLGGALPVPRPLRDTAQTHRQRPPHRFQSQSPWAVRWLRMWLRTVPRPGQAQGRDPASLRGLLVPSCHLILGPGGLRQGQCPKT